MGLFGKIKDILFDEEEEIEPKKEKPAETIKIVEREKNIETEYKPPVVERPMKHEYETPEIEPPSRSLSELDNYSSEHAFPFPDFDEDEFESVRPLQKTKSTNVLDFERNKRKEKRNEYTRLEKVESVEKKKFKPSPIISPVYGILNEDYVADDIINREDVLSENREITVESVRKKAFGELDEMPKKEIHQEPEIVKSYEPPEEKQQKVKTIDELLEDTSDVKISLDDEEVISPRESIIEENINDNSNEANVSNNDYEETLENDLFDLIDSMYDKGEDGE